ncbi:agmatinase [Falsiroseomonas ponticola]|uniref:agmatinase n=1 Tax=Falsiroseomonas ponticola TaxID=2786951 RepID=UPI0019335F66|nr:agmatinase [Roseomonas ponticola]
MDQDRLAGLKARFGAAASGAGETEDPLFRRIIDSQFQGDRRAWPFAGISTFCGARLEADPIANPPEIGLLGVPMDLGVTNRAGSRLGPRALRAVERIGPYEPALHMAPLTEARVADIGDVPMASRFSLEQCHADIEAHVARLHAAGIRLVSAGGDHSISLPILKALGRDRPLGMVHIDAHADTGGEYEGTRFHHGGPFRQAVLEGVLDPDRTIQIGIRGGAGYLWEFSTASGMTLLPMHEVAAMGIPAVIARARQVATGPIYVSFDIDAVDPGFAPGTGTPEVGGLAPVQVLELLRGLAGLDVVGGDVVEVAPQYDGSTATAQIGAQVMFQVICLLARAPSFRR